MAYITDNLVLDLDANYQVTTSLSGSVPVVTNWGDNHYLMNNDGKYNNATSSNATYCPLYETGSDNIPYLLFPWTYGSTTNSMSLQVSSSLGPIASRSCSVYVVCSTFNNDNINGGTVFAFSQSYSWMHFGLQNLFCQQQTTINYPVNKMAYACVGRPADSVAQMNLQRYTTAAQTSFSFSGSIISGRNDGLYSFFGKLYRVMVYAQTHSNAQIDQTMTQLCSDYNIPTSYDKQIVCMGDSITAGAQSTNLHAYPVELHKLCPTYLIYNRGLSGRTIGASGSLGMYDKCVTEVNPLFSSSFSVNKCILFGGTNDIAVSGKSGSVTYGYLTSSCQNLKSLNNWSIDVITSYDRNTYSTEFDVYNNLIRSNSYSNPYFDRVIDLGKQSQYGWQYFSTSSNSTYFSADAIHPNSNGYTTMAQVIYQGWYMNQKTIL